MSKLGNFIDEVVARFKGDDAEVIATKNKRKAIAGVEFQLSALRSEKVKAEDEAEDAQERFKTTLYPTELITDQQSYCNGLKYAKEALDTAEERLESIEDSIAFFTEQLAKINA